MNSLSKTEFILTWHCYKRECELTFWSMPPSCYHLIEEYFFFSGNVSCRTCSYWNGRENRRFTFLLLGSKSRVGIYLVLWLPINLYILKFHLGFLKKSSLSMQTWKTAWRDGINKLYLTHIACLNLIIYLFFHREMWETAYCLYELAIPVEKDKQHSQTLPMLFVHYSRFAYLVSY